MFCSSASSSDTISSLFFFNKNLYFYLSFTSLFVYLTESIGSAWVLRELMLFKHIDKRI